jgi:hypothetical protein
VRFRPAKGWPEFVDDILIVVIGVVLALMAQEFLQQLHQRGAARDARNNVLDEVGRNIARYRERIATESCIDRRLDLIAGILSQSSPVPRPLWLGRPQFWGTPTGRWQALLREQQDAFSSADLGTLSTLYATFDQVRDFQEDEQRAWARLRALEFAELSGPLRQQAIMSLQEARLSNYQIYVAMTQAIDAATKLGVKPVGKPEGSLSVCLPPNISRADALRRIGRSANEEP